MPRLLALGVLTAALLTAGGLADEASPGDARAAAARLGRGINLGNTLEAPEEGDWGVRLEESYFREIKSAGFATVRLPVKWSGHALAAAPYTIEPKFAERVDWAVDQALANGLNIIVNVHHYDEIAETPEEHLPRLIAIWRQIASRYQDRPAGLYFELLNEPNSEMTEAKWNAALGQLLAAIRETNPARPVIVGPGVWNNIEALEKLVLPDDRNLVVTFHFYEPFEFTHQGASWVEESGQWKGRKWRGTPAEKEAITAELEKAAAWGAKHGRPMFLGEFGAYEQGDLESRARWTGHVAREAERLGFAWAYWEFCAGFGAYDPRAKSWREPLKAALLKQVAKSAAEKSQSKAAAQ